MNNINCIQNGETWIHFKLLKAIQVHELATLLETETIGAGFQRLISSISNSSTEAMTVGENLSLPAESLSEAIPLEGPFVWFASSRFIIPELNLKLKLHFGPSEDKPFQGNSLMDTFTLRVNCRMLHYWLPDFIESIEDMEVRRKVLVNPKKIYSLVKRLFDVTNAEKCIGVDGKHYVGNTFDDPPAFFFSRTEPEIRVKLLEEMD